ncbi:unnamed protein product [Cyclocybe aegerita]|uniref:Uncharacterized protein n=1 Tax=Cyclocybe aegerita TaxID=1973307 RepID=A0A8S0WTV1_CYCAE|nr:unnamed protein product [Cyclocybe aegerita]
MILPMNKTRQRASNKIRPSRRHGNNSRILIQGHTFSGVQALLGLKEDERRFRNMKENMRNLVARFLVIEEMASKQQGGIIMIINELQKIYPDVFKADADERIALARSWISVLHLRRRQAQQRRSNGTSKSLGEAKGPARIILDLTNLSDSELSDSDDDPVADVLVDREQPYASAISARRCDGAPALVTSTAAVQKSAGPGPLLSPHATSTAQPSQEQDNPRRAEATFKTSTSANLVNRSVMAQRPSSVSAMSAGMSTTSIGAQELKSDGLYQFLSGCTPSMAHLHSLFVAYGCVDEEYLYAASTWPADQIYDFLKDIGKQSKENNKVTEMDIRILRRRLQSYFADV